MKNIVFGFIFIVDFVNILISYLCEFVKNGEVVVGVLVVECFKNLLDNLSSF